jgi:hypothetical protein
VEFVEFGAERVAGRRGRDRAHLMAQIHHAADDDVLRNDGEDHHQRDAGSGQGDSLSRVWCGGRKNPRRENEQQTGDHSHRVQARDREFNDEAGLVLAWDHTKKPRRDRAEIENGSDPRTEREQLEEAKRAIHWRLRRHCIADPKILPGSPRSRFPPLDVGSISQRDIHRNGGNARELTSAERNVLEPFFSAEIVAKVRVAQIESLQNPWFYKFVRRIGVKPPLDMSRIDGIALEDTVVIAGSRIPRGREWNSLLFHEMVHVAQYAELGRNEFMRQYVRGYLASGLDYFEILLERQAYRLPQRFDLGPGRTFNVVAGVHKLFAKDRS